MNDWYSHHEIPIQLLVHLEHHPDFSDLVRTQFIPDIRSETDFLPILNYFQGTSQIYYRCIPVNCHFVSRVAAPVIQVSGCRQI